MRSTIALLLSLLAATPQTPRIPSIGETIEVSIVNVDVFVTDKQGNRVTGMKKDDFEIYEDGKLQPISNFVEYRDDVTSEQVSVTGGEAPAIEQPKRQKRTLVIFVDNFAMQPNHRKDVFTQLRATVDSLIEPGDAVAIVKWSTIELLRVTIPFTDDRAKLDAALIELAEDRALGETAISDQQVVDFEAEASQWHMPGGRSAPKVAGSRNQRPLSDELGAMEARKRMKKKCDALRSLLMAMGGAEGEKALIFLASDFGVGPQGLSANTDIGYANMDFTFQPMIDDVTRAANANGVRVYAIDPIEHDLPMGDASLSESNMQSAGGVYATLQNQLSGLQTVAERTGGELTWYPSEAIKLLARVPDDFHAYYSLAYRATPSGKDRKHKIVVKTKRADLKVRARTEVVERSEETKMEERVNAKLFSLATASQPKIPLQLRAGKVLRKSGGRYVLPIAVQIPIGALTAVPDGKTSNGAFSVYFAWSVGLGGVGDVTHRTQPFSIPTRDLTKAQQSHFTYDLEVVVDRKTNRLAVGVLDEVSHDFGIETIDVKADELAASSSR